MATSLQYLRGEKVAGGLSKNPSDKRMMDVERLFRRKRETTIKI